MSPDYKPHIDSNGIGWCSISCPLYTTKNGIGYCRQETMSGKTDWTPDANDPAFEAGYKYVEDQVERADGMHGPAPWFYGWAVRTAFWNGMRYQQQRDEAERDRLTERVHILQRAQADALANDTRLAEERDRLEARLREQTAQTQETADQIHHHVVDKLQRHNAIPDGIDPYGHPTEQLVGTCLSNLEDRIAELQEIVAKLPKCWRLNEDGELVQDVPVAPGMPLFVSFAGLVPRLFGIVWVAQPSETECDLLVRDGDGNEYEVDGEDCYATEEAARFAAERKSNDA